MAGLVVTDRDGPGLATLERELKALDIPAIQERLKQIGVQEQPMSPEQFAKYFADDVAAMIKLGKDANIAATQ